MKAIRHKVASILCTELIEENKILKSLYENATKHNSKLHQLKLENSLISNYIKRSNELGQNGCQLLEVGQTNNGSRAVIYLHKYDDSIDIIIEDLNERKILTLYSKLYKDEDRIFIIDIQIGEENCSKGYGALAMSHLIKIANDSYIKRINGNVMPRDWDHIESLERFYSKNGFEVTLNHNKQQGTILWRNKYNKDNIQ